MAENCISVKELYDEAVKIKNHKKFSKKLRSFNCVVKSDDYQYPDDYDPYYAIELFFNNNGIELWENAKKYTYIIDWLKKSQYKLLQHPVTGDTIFHVNPNIIFIFNLDESFKNLKNFNGIPVIYKDLMQYNLI